MLQEKKDLFDLLEIAAQRQDIAEIDKLFLILSEKFGEASLDELLIYHHQNKYPAKEEPKLPEEMEALFERIETAARTVTATAGANENVELECLFSELSLQFGEESFDLLSIFHHKRTLLNHSMDAEPDILFQEDLQKPQTNSGPNSLYGSLKKKG